MSLFLVQNSDDDGPGSLRDAIDSANVNPGLDRIQFQIPDGATIALDSGDLTITDDLNIRGSGQTIDAQGLSRIFSITSDTEASVADLTLTGGNGKIGGAINNAGTLSISGSTLEENAVFGSHFYYGPQYQSTVAGGGAIYNSGNLFMFQSAIAHNGLGDDGWPVVGAGGAIFNAGKAEIFDSNISFNDAYNGGGAIYNTQDGSIKVTRTDIIFNGSYVDSSNVNYGYLLFDEVLLDREGSFFDGALSNSGIANIFNSWVYNTVTPAGNTIENSGQLSIRGSAFSDAELGGYSGILNYESGYLVVSNSTFSGNTSYYDGVIGNQGTAVLSNISVSNNEGDFGASIVNTGYLTLANSVIANSVGVPDLFDSGTLILEGVNLIEDGSVVGQNIINADPNLGPLADNGGPTMTQALQLGSLAIDGGDNNQVPPDQFTDQRGIGFPRIVDGDGDGIPVVDLGAFEFEPNGTLPQFPDVAEHQPVDPSLINGLDPELLVGEGTEIVVEFVSGVAEQENSFGWYTIDDDGAFEDVALLDANLGDTLAGTVFSLGVVAEGQSYGFFLVKNGFGGSELIQLEGLGLNGSLSLVDRETGAPGMTDGQNPLLLQATVNGSSDIIRGVPIFHASTYDDNGNPLNLGGEMQSLSGLSSDGELTFAFEDVTRGEGENFGNSDNDFNDAIFQFVGDLDTDDSMTTDFLI